MFGDIKHVQEPMCGHLPSGYLYISRRSSKLFIPIWLRRLSKVADWCVCVPVVHSFWSRHNFEDLIIACVFIFLPFRPWQLKCTPKMFSISRAVQGILGRKGGHNEYFIRTYIGVWERFYHVFGYGVDNIILRKIAIFFQSSTRETIHQKVDYLCASCNISNSTTK